MLDRFVLRYWLGADCSHICDKFVMKCGLFIYVWQVLLHCGLSECVSLVCINPSAWGHLIPSSYCDVGRFPAGYLTFELNCAGIYSN